MSKKQRSELEVLINDKDARLNGANKKKFHVKDLNPVNPMTENQKKLFHSYNSNLNMFLYGSAGTGKTFLSLYLALRDVLDESTPYDRLIIVRSSVATRDMGFLPGTEQEKMHNFEAPYDSICNELFTYSKSYENLKKLGYVEFYSTSYLRGVTFNNAIVLVDEAANCNFHELDSLITRVGRHSKIIFSGDISQTDLLKSRNDKTGLDDFLNIVNIMSEFAVIRFEIKDIVRSSLVKNYLLCKNKIID